MHSNDDLLKEALLNEVSVQFNLKDDWQFVPYFLFRKKIARKEKAKDSLFPINYIDLGTFIIEQLAICSSMEGIKLMSGETFPSQASYGSPYRRVLEELWFETENRSSITEKEWDKKANDLLVLAKKSTSFKRTHFMYDTCFEQHAYGYLSQAFHAIPTGECGDLFVLKEEALFFPTREEQIERLIHSYNHTLQQSERVSEEAVEQFLMRNLNLLQEGLKIVDNQVILAEGRIDLLARTAQGQDVIIEVKVEKDTDLIWQRMYYEAEWMKTHAQPLMVVVSTLKLDPSIKEMLKRVGRTEIFEVTPFVRQGKIEQLVIDERYTLEPDSQLQSALE